MIASVQIILCRALRRIAHDGTTVIMSIHQPRIEIFQMFTQLVFLTRDGRVAYCGPSRNVRSYLDTELLSSSCGLKGTNNNNDQDLTSSRSEPASNPADALLDVMAVRRSH